MGKHDVFAGDTSFELAPNPLRRAVDAEWLWESQLTLEIPSASLRPLFHSRSSTLLVDTDIHAKSTEHHLYHSHSKPEKRSMRTGRRGEEEERE